MCRPHEFDAAGKAIQEGIQVEPHVPEIVLKRHDVGVEAAEHQAPPALHPRHRPQPQRAQVRGTLQRRRLWNLHQGAIHRIGPAVIGTDKAPGVAVTGPAYGQAPVGAAVDAGMDGAVLPPGQDDRRLTHAGLDKVARVTNLRFMAEKQPGSPEDTALLQGIDGRVGPAAAANPGSIRTDQPIDRQQHESTINYRTLI